MGTWGAALYDDDNAADLKDSIGLACKVPVPGNRLLEILKEIHGDCDPDDEDGALFWLVTADQFERKGIDCQEVTATALSIIKSGKDLQWAREKEADDAFIKKRTAVLQELAGRLKSPRKFRPRVPPRNPPPMVLATGEVYAFRTMRDITWHPYWLPKVYPEFVPDGWGALVVLETGRAFDWLPWAVLASLTVKGDRKPTLEETQRCRLIFHDQLGAGRFIPNSAHAKKLQWELLDKLELDAKKVKPLCQWTVEKALHYDYTMAYGAVSPKCKEKPRGCELSLLIKDAKPRDGKRG